NDKSSLFSSLKIIKNPINMPNAIIDNNIKSKI
ncbi:hypothetical protein LCGC14_2497980, partial [marine sediment metagenome]